MLVLTSANLNQNRRIENYSLIADSGMVSEYRSLVEDLYLLQLETEGFDDPKAGRRATVPLLAGKPEGDWLDDLDLSDLTI